MGVKFIFWALFLNLLVTMCCYGMDMDHHHHHHHEDKNGDDDDNEHLDPSTMVFLTMKDIKVGNRMPIHFPKRDPSKSPKVWPKEEADTIPFSLSQLPYLLQHFSFSQDSPQAKAMEATLRECESNPIKGEVKFCATSLESMLDFARTMLGSEIQVFTTSHISKSSVKFQNYTMLETLMEMEAPKMVACHTMPYPYAVFYCHSQKSENRVYKMLLRGDNGDKVEAMVVCHLDTSQWNPTHISFRVLKLLPGTSSICHFFPADHLIYLPKLQANNGASSM